MISIDINLDPMGSVAHRESLATIAIWNDVTGDWEVGNYGWAISHQHDSIFGRRAARASGLEVPTAHDLTKSGPWVWKSGAVKGFRRDRGAVALLAQVMKAVRL